MSKNLLSIEKIILENFSNFHFFRVLTFEMVGHHWALLIGSIELTWPFFISREKRHSSITHFCARFFAFWRKKKAEKYVATFIREKTMGDQERASLVQEHFYFVKKK